MTAPLWILAVLGFNVALSEWLVRRTALRHVGSALLVILLTALVANLRVIPSVTVGSPVYDGVFSTLAPLAIFWMLLEVHLKSVLRVGAPLLGLFLLGAVGTLVGAFAGMALVGGARAFGELHPALTGMFVGTYVGGSINFNAVALEYGVVKDGVMYAGAAVVDNAATTVWMAATVALPRLLGRRREVADAGEVPESSVEEVSETETVSATDLGVLTSLGAATLWISNTVASWCQAQGLTVPSILVLTTIALVLAQLPAVQRLRGARVVGWFAVLVFLAVIGALCDLDAMAGLGDLAPSLLGLVFTIVAVHGTIVFVGARLLGLDPDVAAVASQANIGGGTSALALARSLDRPDLVLPAILVGSLGNALGTYLGFLAAAFAG